MKNKLISFIFETHLGMFLFLMIGYSIVGLIVSYFIPWHAFFITYEIFGIILASVMTILFYRD